MTIFAGLPNRVDSYFVFYTRMLSLAHSLFCKIRPFFGAMQCICLKFRLYLYIFCFSSVQYRYSISVSCRVFRLYCVLCRERNPFNSCWEEFFRIFYSFHSSSCKVVVAAVVVATLITFAQRWMTHWQPVVPLCWKSCWPSSFFPIAHASVVTTVFIIKARDFKHTLFLSKCTCC